MSEKLKLAIDEAVNAANVTDNAILALHKILCAENPLAADLFMKTLKDSAELRSRLERLQSVANEKSK